MPNEMPPEPNLVFVTPTRDKFGRITSYYHAPAAGDMVRRKPIAEPGFVIQTGRADGGGDGFITLVELKALIAKAKAKIRQQKR